MRPAIRSAAGDVGVETEVVCAYAVVDRAGHERPCVRTVVVREGVAAVR